MRLLGPLLPALLAALIGGGMGNVFASGIERPPKEYRKGFKKDGVTERRFDEREALNIFCLENGVSYGANPPANPFFEACFVPGLGVVALPSEKLERDPWKRKDLREHEWGHVHGWRHDPAPLDMKKLMADFHAKRNIFSER